MASGNSGWLDAVTGIVVIATVAVVAVLTVATEASFWATGLTGLCIILTALLIWAILPRRYELYDDRLVMVFGFWRWNIGLDSLELAQPATSLQSYSYWGMRFSTKPSQAVEIRRLNSNIFTRPNLIVSPDDRATFLAELNTALARYRRLHGAPA